MQGISSAGVSVVAVVMFSSEHDVSAYFVAARHMRRGPSMRTASR